MKTVLLIGSGYVGLSLALKLSENDFDVTLTTTTHEKQQQLKEAGLHSLVFNASVDNDYAQLNQLQPDYFIFTLPPSVCKFHGYRNTLEKIVSSIKEFNTVLFTSSISVYINNGKLHSEESTDVDPTSIILETEKYITSHYNNHYIFRLAGLIGDKRHPKNFHKNGIVANSNQPVNLVQVDDVVQIIFKSIVNKIPFDVYNVCSPEHPTKRDYYQKHNSSLAFVEGTEGKMIDSIKLVTLTGHVFKSIFF